LALNRRSPATSIKKRVVPVTLGLEHGETPAVVNRARFAETHRRDILNPSGEPPLQR
jgi:hypothetical protein